MALHLLAVQEERELPTDLVHGVLPCRLNALTEETQGLNLSWLFLLQTAVLLHDARLRIREEILKIRNRGILPDEGQLLQCLNIDYAFQVPVVVYLFVR